MNNNIYKLQFLPFAYVIILIVMFVLPFFSYPEYNIIKNTTSHLGSQNAPNAWIMNVTFVFIGLATIIDGWRSLGSFFFHKMAITLFGISLIACAFFQHAPILEEISFNVKEDSLHSLFANITGFSFTAFAIATSFIIKGWFQKILALLIGIIVTLLSILMFEVVQFMGVWQRIIFIISFAWLILVFNRINKHL